MLLGENSGVGGVPGTAPLTSRRQQLRDRVENLQIERTVP